jgi:hypothetical protein
LARNEKLRDDSIEFDYVPDLANIKGSRSSIKVGFIQHRESLDRGNQRAVSEISISFSEKGSKSLAGNQLSLTVMAVGTSPSMQQIDILFTY